LFRSDSWKNKIYFDILKVYDSMENSLKRYLSLPVTTNEKKLLLTFNLYKWLPGLGYEDEDGKIKISSPVAQRDAILDIGVVPRTNSDSFTNPSFRT